jgi:hypothetical protein
MPRELSIFGILIPTLLPIFLSSLLILGLLDRVLGLAGVYKLLWHPALVRLCLFAGIFAGLTITLYQ